MSMTENNPVSRAQKVVDDVCTRLQGLMLTSDQAKQIIERIRMCDRLPALTKTKCMCACHEHPGTYFAEPCSFCGHYHSKGTLEVRGQGWVPN